MTRFCGDIKPIFPFGPPENVRKPFGFLIFSEGPKWKHGFKYGFRIFSYLKRECS